jgi:restriction system protein
MSLWLVRAGKYGEYEEHFLTTNSIYLTWDSLEQTDLGKAKSFDDIKSIVRTAFPEFGAQKFGNHSGQIWAFVVAMKPGDLLAVPRKTTPAIAFGEITGEYHHDPAASGQYQHSRSVRWLKDVPRSTIDQDLLYSLGAILTICEVKRNNAEERIRKMLSNGAKVAPAHQAGEQSEPAPGSPAHSEQSQLDLEELARDQIAKHINAKFKGHGLARLVDAILKAQG